MTLEDIKKEVEQATWIKDFTEKGRDRKRLIPRMIFCQLAREFSGARLTRIGEFINRDHATVLHYEKNFKYALDKPEKEIYNEIRGRFLMQDSKTAKRELIAWFNSIPESKYPKLLKRAKAISI